MPTSTKIINTLDQLLGIDPDDPATRRAETLHNENMDMIQMMTALRKEKGLSRQDIAVLIGCTKGEIADFEGYDSNPQLSMIELYANAVGAVVRHTVTN